MAYNHSVKLAKQQNGIKFQSSKQTSKIAQTFDQVIKTAKWHKISIKLTKQHNGLKLNVRVLLTIRKRHTIRSENHYFNALPCLHQFLSTNFKSRIVGTKSSFFLA